MSAGHDTLTDLFALNEASPSPDHGAPPNRPRLRVVKPRPRELSLTTLSLDFASKASRYGEHFERFLADSDRAAGRQPGTTEAERYLAELWPEGLVARVLVSRVDHEGHPRWELRPDPRDPGARTATAGGVGPVFRTYRRQGRLVVNRFERGPHVAQRPHEVAVVAAVRRDANAQRTTKEDFRLLEEIPPFVAAHRQGLEDYSDYVEWLLRLLRAEQCGLPYSGVRVDADGGLVFRVSAQHLEDIPGGMKRLKRFGLLAVPLEASASSEDWQPTYKGRPRGAVKVGTVVARDKAGKGFVQISTQLPLPDVGGSSTGEGDPGPAPAAAAEGDQQRPQAGERRTKEAPAKPAKLPGEGFLILDLGGDIGPLKNQQRAVQRLSRGKAVADNLHNFVFDAKEAALPAPTPTLGTNAAEGVPAGGADPNAPQTLNEDQRAAAQKAVLAPELFLLQGPPGTGKTTVIAEIARREVAQGHRVLVASQANLAVDNALARLPEGPSVRPLRIARSERVEEVYAELLAENVVPGWLAKIHAACSAARGERVVQVGDLDRLQRDGERLERDLDGLERRGADLAELRPRLVQAEQTLRRAEQERDSLREQADGHTRRRRVFKAVLAWARRASRELPEGLHLLPQRLGERDAALLAQVLGVLRFGAAPAPRQGRPGSTFTALLRALEQLEQARTAAAALADCLHGVEGLCREQATALDAETRRELGELRARKSRLVDSEEPDALAELGRVNRRLRELPRRAWAKLQRRLLRVVTSLLGAELPPEVDELISALEPNAKHLPILQRLGEWTSAIEECWLDAEATHLPHIASRLSAALDKVDSSSDEVGARLVAARDAVASVTEERDDFAARVAESTTALHRLAREWDATALRVARAAGAADSGVGRTGRRERLALTRRAVARRRAAASDVLVEHERWDDIQRGFLGRLRSPDESMVPTLRDLYLAHANVVGLTCNEAGKHQFYEAAGFRPYDVVIIDEVSKAAPTELLMPMLLARKVILVGDHHQLPPIFRQRAEDHLDALERGLVNQEEFDRFKTLVTGGVFQRLFASAPEELRHTLRVQYRMHPQIMDAVQPFYPRGLEAGGGVEDLGRRRAHDLTVPDRRGGFFLEPAQHLIWVDSSRRPDGTWNRETQEGTSKSNTLEVELVGDALLRLNKALSAQGYGEPVELTASAELAGVAMGDWVKRTLPRVPGGALGDLFDEGQVRRNGDLARAGDPIEEGDVLGLQPRQTVGVISFYGAQLKRLRQWLDVHEDDLGAMDVRCSTVDRFQGLDRAIIFVSLVRSKKRGKLGEFVRAYQRINVAFSRAKQLLVVVGSQETFQRAIVELPGEPGQPPRQASVYAEILQKVHLCGGLRQVDQLLETRADQ